MQRKSKSGSVVLDKRSRRWNFFWWGEDGKRHSKTVGPLSQFPTKTSAWRAAQALRDAVEAQPKPTRVPTVRALIEAYRLERMPDRASTRRGYEIWFRNHILPRWADNPITDLEARPVDLWLRSLDLAPKSRAHIRGLLRTLWDYSMWRGDIPIQRNPMELVTIKGATQRIRISRSLTAQEFQTLLTAFGDSLKWRTFFLLAVSFGLRISEVLGLKWKDVDWLGKTLSIRRGVVKAIVDDVKSKHSAKTMACADEILSVLRAWKLTAQFSDNEDWIFASEVQLGRMPISYTHVWNTLTETCERLQIPHLSSHSFRHTYRSWLDSVGSPIGVQQRMMRHADIRTTMNVYGDAIPADMREAHEKVVRLATASGTAGKTAGKTAGGAA